jgi:hypothetical protein
VCGCEREREREREAKIIWNSNIFNKLQLVHHGHILFEKKEKIPNLKAKSSRIGRRK